MLFHRGSFGNLSDKEQYYHLEPLNPVDNSVSFLAASGIAYMVCAVSDTSILISVIQLEQPLAFYLSREYQHMEGTCGRF